MSSAFSDRLRLDEALLGSDFDLSSGDLAATSLKSFKLISGVNKVLTNYIREVATPYGRMARFSWNRDGIDAIDLSYGCRIHSRLSEPVRGNLLDLMESDLVEVATHHPELVLEDISREVLSGTPLRIVFTLVVRVQNSAFSIVLGVDNRAVQFLNVQEG